MINFPALIKLMSFLVLFISLGLAHSATTGSFSSTISPEIIKTKLEEAEASKDLDDETKKKVAELYKKSLANLEQEKIWERAADRYEQARKTAADEASTIRQKLEADIKAKSEVTLDVNDKTPLADIEQRLLTEKANEAAVNAKISEMEQQFSDQANRPVEARKQLTDAQQRQEALSRELNLPPANGELLMMTEARRWALETERAALSAKVRMLDQELLSQPMRVDLLRAQRDKSRRDISRINTRVNLLVKLVNDRRQAEAERAMAESEATVDESEGKPPFLLAVAEENTALSQVLYSLAATREYVTSQINRVSDEANRIESEFSKAQKKLEIAGLGQVLGQLLQEQRRALPDLQQYRKEAKIREQLNVASVLRQIDFNDERSQLADVDTVLTQLTENLDPQQAEAISNELKDLLIRQRDLLDKAISADEAYLRSLSELDQAQRKLLDISEAYDNFLAENLLWVRSTTPVSRASVFNIPKDLRLLLSPDSWIDAAKTLTRDAIRNPYFYLLILLVLLLQWKRKYLRDSLRATGMNLNKISTDKLSYTFMAMLLTVLLAMQWPLLMAGIGLLLRDSLSADHFSRAVGQVLVALSVPLFSLRAFKMLCMPGGLADVHYHWPDSSLNLFRKELHRFTLIAIISAFVAMVSARVEPVSQGGALAIIAFMVLLIALAFFLFQTLHPKRGAFHEYLIRNPRSTLARFRFVWFPAAVGAPLVFAGLAVNGFTYTASTLLSKMTSTLWLVLLLVLVQQFALRWLLLMHRRLTLKAAIERREAARAQAEEKAREAGEDVPTLSDEGVMSVEQAQVDLDALSQESRKLLNLALAVAGLAGLWLIWSGLLPAFSILDDVVLWHRTATISGVEQQVPVTLVDFAFTLLIVVITILAIKRLPALLEIILLQRLQLTPGSRYAVKALVSYFIGAVGILYALSVVGFSWSKVQWLAAALTVGIGFGLQEIVANFISGLIILFERPIRVGDVVTIGDTDGVVTRIQIRATTIRNWDRKELLVPNKEFITSRLLNWSLTDPVTRIHVAVGIAYGSDVQLAMKLMMEAAEENEFVLDDPKHYVIFTMFGDNSLNLELRAFLGSIEDRLLVLSMLNNAINDKFNKAGVVISFPQRDVHLDTSRPLDIRLHSADSEIGAITPSSD